MKILAILFLMFSLSHAKIYYSKVEPYEIRDISSNVSGLVLSIDENMIGKKLTSDAYITIDSELDAKELAFIKDKLEYLREIIKVNENVLVNLEKSLVRKRENYKRITDLKFKSAVEKDKEYYDLISNENLYLSTQKEIQNLKVQITDLKLREAHLKRSVSDKYLSDKGFVLYEISVKVGQVVGVSTPLAKVADTSKAKLTIYLDEEDVADAKNKVVYINGEKTSYKISRSLNIADSKNISKYMAQIIIDSPKLFSKLATVELKDK
ncbi:HlyD family efflux transporter periplasmic adaptor subunit [Sulfurimonas sp.]|uniref:HlyD family efflux transporter periplasmic adaptor subunit n=1 Tax=Sulfurimonas sp. TaxID=2022749 RepID=UPI0035623780